MTCWQPRLPRRCRQALFHVDGRASEIFLGNGVNNLIEAGALAEACIDFTDEEGVADAALPQGSCQRVEHLIKTMTENLK